MEEVKVAGGIERGKEKAGGTIRIRNLFFLRITNREGRLNV